MAAHGRNSSGGRQKVFRPPATTVWQDETARRLNLRVEYHLKYGARKHFDQYSSPKLTASVRPDGNCFFRALSLIITGVEDNHLSIRRAITKHVEDHADIYRTFLQSRGGMENYVRSMRRPREWATDTEIFAASTYLNTVIEVCTPTDAPRHRTEYHWQTFSPLKDHSAGIPVIYISHKDDHFEPILDIESCNRW